MYTRSYGTDEDKMTLPSGYDGTAFEKEISEKAEEASLPLPEDKPDDPTDDPDDPGNEPGDNPDDPTDEPTTPGDGEEDENCTEPDTTPNDEPEELGFFARIWQAILDFFRRIFGIKKD